MNLFMQVLGRFVGLDLFREELGVGHADELSLIFQGSTLPLETAYTDSDKEVSKLLVKMMTNFARTGNPSVEGVPEWKRQVKSSCLIIRNIYGDRSDGFFPLPDWTKRSLNE